MEIGSDFEIDLNAISFKENNIFKYLENYKTLFFDSGRNALKFLLDKIPFKSAVLPNYICESVTDCFSGKEIFFYKINESFCAEIKDLEKIDFENLDIFYLMNYFGSLQSGEIREYLKKKKEKYNFLIIEDTTHSIFSSPDTIGDFCVCSLRKWFPVPDGGVLYSKGLINSTGFGELARKESERINAMVLKSLYLKGELNCKETFRKIFLKTEEEFESEKIKRISDLSEFLLKCFDTDSIKRKRRENYKLLESIISKYLPPEIEKSSENIVPFTYITALKNRDEFKKYLIENKIFCAVHWPVPECIKDEKSKELFEKSISVPIDQRYGKEEIEKAGEIIGGFFNE